MFEEVIFDVNRSVRLLDTSYDQIAPSFEAAQARQQEVESTRARAQARNYAELTSELGAVSSLAQARRDMLRNMVNYNISIIDLERAKGTLLRYNQIEVPMSEEKSKSRKVEKSKE